MFCVIQSRTVLCASLIVFNEQFAGDLFLFFFIFLTHEKQRVESVFETRHQCYCYRTKFAICGWALWITWEGTNKKRCSSVQQN